MKYNMRRNQYYINNSKQSLDFIGPYQEHQLYYMFQGAIDEEYDRLRNNDDYVNVGPNTIPPNIKCRVAIDEVVIPLYYPRNNIIENQNLMMGKEIYQKVHALADEFQISGYDTLRNFWLYLWRSEHVIPDFHKKTFENLTNYRKIELQCKFNNLLYDISLGKRCDLMEIMIKIQQKNYQITREEYNNIISPFINRRSNQPIFQLFMKSQKRIDDRESFNKIQEGIMLTRYENKIPQPDLYSLRNRTVKETPEYKGTVYEYHDFRISNY